MPNAPETKEVAKIGWDGRVAVTEATGPNVTGDGKTYELIGKDANGSPVYQDVEVLKEQTEKGEDNAKLSEDDDTAEIKDERKAVEKTEDGAIITTTKEVGIQFFAEKTVHANERIEQRGLSETGVDDALANPLYKGDVIVDNAGRKSVKYIGKDVTVIWNPDTGEVITAWKTGTRIRRKYGGD